MVSNPRDKDDRRLRATPWLMIKAALPAAVGAGLLAIAEHPVQLLVTAVLVPIVTAGLVGRHGLPDSSSRLPSVLQGVFVGAYLGVVAAAVVLDAWDWTIVVWIVPLCVLFPAVIPARLRGPLMAKIEVDEDAVERTRWK